MRHEIVEEKMRRDTTAEETGGLLFDFLPRTPHDQHPQLLRTHQHPEPLSDASGPACGAPPSHQQHPNKPQKFCAHANRRNTSTSTTQTSGIARMLEFERQRLLERAAKDQRSIRTALLAEREKYLLPKRGRSRGGHALPSRADLLVLHQMAKKPETTANKPPQAKPPTSHEDNLHLYIPPFFEAFEKRRTGTPLLHSDTQKTRFRRMKAISHLRAAALLRPAHDEAAVIIEEARRVASDSVGDARLAKIARDTKVKSVLGSAYGRVYDQFQEDLFM